MEKQFFRYLRTEILIKLTMFINVLLTVEEKMDFYATYDFHSFNA